MCRSRTLLLAVSITIALGTLAADAQQPGLRGREQFEVTATEDAFVLLERNTGRTWLLVQGEGEGRGWVWTPIGRIDESEQPGRLSDEQRPATGRREQDDRLHKLREDHERRRQEREEQFDRDVHARRRQLEQLRRETQRKHAATSLRMLLEAERNLQQQLEQKREQGADEEVIKHLKRLKQNVTERLKDAHRESLNNEEPEERETDERHEIEHKEREVIERRRQFQKRQREHDEARAEQDGRSQNLQESRKFYGRNDAAIRKLQERVEKLEQQLHERTERDSSASTSPELLELLQKEAVLLQTHGPNSPELRTVRKRIEVFRDLETKAAPKKLFPLLLEQEILLQSHGPEHPKVVEIQRKIDITREFLEKTGGARERDEDR